ncbi:hypothetical protein [Bathymodiolus japonicus methanotrophic gill symbiont]|uniref:hypothetical protein n=1 Tax=Bathymodiolus japonicus methanotrophic gill symbiont TaxID=113269 RepID=UPI001C8D3268|nr:hypothetical protein [Bathymodiolus japonicus methanotrophic gill symbiont]
MILSIFYKLDIQMNKVTFIPVLMIISGAFSLLQVAHAADEATVYRRTNFSNEFNISTPEGINARGYAEVESTGSIHKIKIHADGLFPDETYVLLNHWMEPVPERGVPDSAGALVDPSCNGHTQTLIVQSDTKGMIDIEVTANQLAPHIWVANFAKFMEVTKNGTQAPANADAFVADGLLIPYADIVEREASFVDTGPLTDCGM